LRYKSAVGDGNGDALLDSSRAGGLPGAHQSCWSSGAIDPKNANLAAVGGKRPRRASAISSIGRPCRPEHATQLIRYCREIERPTAALPAH